MQPSSGLNQGTISTQNIGAPNGNAVTALSTVSAALGGSFDTASIQVAGTYTGVLTVQVQLDNTTWVNLSGANALTNAATGAQSGTIASAAQGIWQLDVSGFTGVRVTALAAVTGSANVSILAGIGSGVVGIDTPITLAAGSAVTSSTPSGTALSVVSAATTNASSQKAAAGNLFEIVVSNPTATPAYVKLYNKATAPTVGTDVPIVTIIAPATSATALPINLGFSQIGKRFSLGIAMAITGAAAATDTTAAVAGVQVHGTYI